MLMMIGVADDSAPSFVLDVASRFLEEQTFGGRIEVDPAPAEFAGDAPVIRFRIVAEQTQMKTALPCGCAVARACVAAGFC